MPKFKLGDKIVRSTGEKATIDSVDSLNYHYTYENGFPWSCAHAILEKEWTIDNGTNPALIQGTYGYVPSSESNLDQYIGKQYKVIVPIRDLHNTFDKGEILEVIGKSLKYHGEIELKRVGNVDKHILSAHPTGYTMTSQLMAYTAPKCTCGLDKTYMLTHRREAPKRIHYEWCDKLKG